VAQIPYSYTVELPDDGKYVLYNRYVYLVNLCVKVRVTGLDPNNYQKLDPEPYYTLKSENPDPHYSQNSGALL
jgi:hypothetical protein